MALRSLEGVVSLDLYRETVAAMLEWQERCHLFEEYLMRIDESLDDDPFHAAHMEP